MKHLVLSISILFTLTASAQTVTVKRLAALVKAHDFINITAYADSLGYGQPLTMPEVGNMYEFSMTTFAKKDSLHYLTYSSGHHYAMDQGPLTVSLHYTIASETEFDRLVAEIKAIGAEEIIMKGAGPGARQYKYQDLTISTYINTTGTGLKYTVGLSGTFWQPVHFSCLPHP